MTFWEFNKKDHQQWCSINGIFSPPEISSIISYKDKTEAIEGKIGGQIVNPEVRKNNVWWISPSPESEWLFDHIESVVHQVNEQYFHLNLAGLHDLQLSQYSENEGGEYYHSHTDSGGSATGRKLSLSVQLSDPTTYEGGDFLLYPINLQPVVLPKWFGNINVFRSNIIHEVTPVTKGTRYSLVAWIIGPELY